MGLSEGALPGADEATERKSRGRQMRKAFVPTKMSGTAIGGEEALPVADKATERKSRGRQMRKAFAPTKMPGTAIG